VKNITLSVDDSLALKLRVAAAQADKSLSRFLAETLEQTLFPAATTATVTATATASRRVGVAKGEFVVPDSIDEANAEVAALFNSAGKFAP
jgi:hypothetical protein